MTILSKWITQIIIFILIGSIIELILPNNSLKRYVNIIVGLLLLLLFTQPLFYLFSIDLKSKLNEIEYHFLNQNNQKSIESSLKNQKNEIESGQAAYILNELQEELIKIASPKLSSDLKMDIVDLDFIFIGENLYNYEDLKTVVVKLSFKDKTEESVGVELVKINTNETLEPLKIKQDKKIRDLIAELWEIPADKLELVIEGGTN